MLRTAYAAFTFGLVAIVSTASYAATITVDQGNPGGWAFSNADNSNNAASGGFVYGPAIPPLGNGSANLMVNDSTKSSSEILINTSVQPNLASGFSATYFTYVTADSVGTTEGSAPALEFDLTKGSYQGRLVFDPGLLPGAVTLGTWQSWDTTNQTAWWFSHSLDGSTCTINNPCTFATAEAFLEGAGITAEDILFKAGSDQTTYNGNVDDLTLTFDGSSTTYNFDVPEPGSLALLGSALLGLAGIGFMRRRRSV